MNTIKITTQWNVHVDVVQSHVFETGEGRVICTMPNTLYASSLVGESINNAFLFAGAREAINALLLARESLIDLGACHDPECDEPNCNHALTAIDAALRKSMPDKFKEVTSP